MLSYRHAFHAGNFADVMKHVVLTALLRYMTRKDSPLCYVDTHAGAGGYELQSDYARKTQESDLGIGKLLRQKDVPEPVAAYLELIHQFNGGAELVRYPGSPWIAASSLRAHDRILLCELHGSDFPKLEQAFKKDRRVHCFAEDGYRFSKGLLPPAERRGLILLDPSYELATEFDTIMTTLVTLHRRFATGTYAVWYPILDSRRTALLRQSVKKAAMRDVLNLELIIANGKTYPGMYGCGMIIVNPPWTLRQDMEAVLPWLVSTLGRDSTATFRQEQWIDE